MERIRQAIEILKKGSSNRSLSENHKLGKFMPGMTSATSNVQEITDVSYTQTRVVPLNHDLLHKNRIVAFDKSDPASLNFDLLRTHVLQKMEEKNYRTLAITSPTPGAGKSMLAINLAMSIAQQTNKTAMLVDFDLRRPKIGSYLGLHMEKSLNELLEGKCELAEVLVNPDLPRLVVLPTGSPIRNSSETLSSRKIADLIQELRDRYESRIIIFDLPPLLITDDTITLLPLMDCTLMVLANGNSTKKEIADSMHLLSSTNLLGTVLNKMDTASADYYYR